MKKLLYKAKLFITDKFYNIIKFFDFDGIIYIPPPIKLKELLINESDKIKFKFD